MDQQYCCKTLIAWGNVHVYAKLQFENTFVKVDSILEQVAKKLNRDYQCSLSPAYLTAAQLSCDPKEKSNNIF